MKSLFITLKAGRCSSGTFVFKSCQIPSMAVGKLFRILLRNSSEA